MVKETKAYTLFCDKCGKQHPIVLTHTKKEAELLAEINPEWYYNNGKTLCPQCFSNSTGKNMDTYKKEVWVPINGFVKYEVSNYGRIKNVLTNRVLLQRDNNNTGYLRVSLYDDDMKPRLTYVHRLVAEHFCQKKAGCTCVDHIDTDKKNNIYTNLRWVTRSENSRNQYTSLRNAAAKRKG